MDKLKTNVRLTLGDTSGEKRFDLNVQNGLSGRLKMKKEKEEEKKK